MARKTNDGPKTANVPPRPNVDPLLLDRIRLRWDIKPVKWPWLLKPCRVSILFYADFGGAYDGGPFDGLKHVIATLNADPYFWVRFDLTLANRGPDASATAGQDNKRLDQLGLQNFDQVWFFGLGGLPDALTAAEKAALKTFMDGGGGVLMTGDHEDLGAAIGSGVPRAGKMRLWSPAPSASGTDRHSTLREGHDPGFVFNDQSDDVPQVIRPKEYPVFSFTFWKRRTRPHPVLCGPDGILDVLPDHMHEGEAVVPAAPLAAAEWPSAAGVQLEPEVIAWAKILQPGLAETGQEFGVISAYDGHPAGAGRIVADATWHHWFDINLIGENGAVVGDTAGFDATPAGQVALKKIEAYFLNVAVWLAPPARQKCMRDRLWWGALWHDPLVMMSPKIPIYILGEFALDALGKYAPQCTIIRWVWDFVIPEVRFQWKDILDRPDPPPPFLEECILGAMLRPLLETARKEGRVPTAPPAEKEVARLMDKAFEGGADAGLAASMEIAEAVRVSAKQLSAVLRK